MALAPAPGIIKELADYASPVTTFVREGCVSFRKALRPYGK